MDDFEFSSLRTFLTSFYSGAGGEVDECSIQLGFYGDDLDPDSITGLLGVSPTSSGLKGEPRPNGNGVNRTSYWMLDCERTTDTADHQIQLLLNIDLPLELKIWQSLSASYFADLRVCLFPVRWQRDTTFSPEVLHLLAERGLRLQIEIYSKRPPVSLF